MTAVVAALSVIAGGIGLWALVAGLRRTPEVAAAPRRSRPRMSAQARRLLVTMVIAAIVGLVLALLTGYVMMILLVPVLAWLAPQLLPHSGSRRTIERLDAMNEWARSLTGVLGAGAGIEQAIIASRSSVPEPLREEVGMLAARLQAGIPTEAALESFGDELDDPTGDLLTGSLILGSRRRGSGLARILESCAETITDDVAARRQIEADRAKPRSNARLIALIAVIVLGAEFLLNPAYVAPYRTPIGQVVLLALVTLFLVALWWMNAATREPKAPRILREAGGAR